MTDTMNTPFTPNATYIARKSNPDNTTVIREYRVMVLNAPSRHTVRIMFRTGRIVPVAFRNIRFDGEN